MEVSMRVCHIVNADFSSKEDGPLDDGAYDLFDKVGTPDQIGKAIAAALRDGDLFQGSHCRSLIDAGHDLYLTVKIKFAETDTAENPTVTFEQMGFKEVETGGRCKALRLDLPAGMYVLATNEDGDCVPDGGATGIGVYSWISDDSPCPRIHSERIYDTQAEAIHALQNDLGLVVRE
jgi:hypothetical protein